MKFNKKNIKICILGLGYVGLPLALKLSEKFKVTGFDINPKRISQLKNGYDITSEFTTRDLLKKKIFYTNNFNEIKSCNFFIITVPTPVKKNKNPDLSYLRLASETVSKILKKNDVVVYESTTYPGCTEEFCIPLLEKFSKLKINKDFFCGYSPERINPGDKIHKLDNIEKIISSSNRLGLNLIQNIYKHVTKKKLIKVDSIKIAEGAKIIENTQRDINIALMNELSILFNKLDIDFSKVLKAANTKWNFLNFKPGLVGGHCIGVDPYYLSFKAKTKKFKTKIVLSGRKLNDQMYKYITKKFIKKLPNKRNKVLLIGLTFKEDVPDSRNSQSINIAKLLVKLNCNVYVFDPLVQLKLPGCISIEKFEKLNKFKKYFDGILLIVPHKKIVNKGYNYFNNLNKKQGIFFDIKNTFNKQTDFKL